MMPLYVIAQRVREARPIDIERLGALLEHHNRTLTVRNDIASDCGDRWVCRLGNSLMSEQEPIEHMAPTLREAILLALDDVCFAHHGKKP